MTDDTNNNGKGKVIRHTARGGITIGAMIVFASLAHMIVHADLPEGIVGVIGGALVACSGWVSTAFNFYFPAPDKTAEKPQ